MNADSERITVERTLTGFSIQAPPVPPPHVYNFINQACYNQRIFEINCKLQRIDIGKFQPCICILPLVLLALFVLCAFLAFGSVLPIALVSAVAVGGVVILAVVFIAVRKSVDSALRSALNELFASFNAADPDVQWSHREIIVYRPKFDNNQLQHNISRSHNQCHTNSVPGWTMKPEKVREIDIVPTYIARAPTQVPPPAYVQPQTIASQVNTESAPLLR
jgi:hypothetical protein